MPAIDRASVGELVPIPTLFPPASITNVLESQLIPPVPLKVTVVVADGLKVRLPAKELPPATAKEDEAFRTPLIKKLEEIVEEAFEINPERLASPPTLRVEEADNGPLTLSWALTVEEAEEIKPDRFASPPTFKVEEADKGPASWRELDIVEEAVAMKPPPKVARLATDKVEEADTGPETFN